MVFRAEGEFAGIAADGNGYGASDDGAGYFAVEIVTLNTALEPDPNLPVCCNRESGGKTAALQNLRGNSAGATAV